MSKYVKTRGSCGSSGKTCDEKKKKTIYTGRAIIGTWENHEVTLPSLEPRPLWVDYSFYTLVYILQLVEGGIFPKAGFQTFLELWEVIISSKHV
jgi:hypothetical protein